MPPVHTVKGRRSSQTPASNWRGQREGKTLEGEGFGRGERGAPRGALYRAWGGPELGGARCVNGCSFKRSWWPLWLSLRRTKGWEGSR